MVQKMGSGGTKQPSQVGFTLKVDRPAKSSQTSCLLHLPGTQTQVDKKIQGPAEARRFDFG